MSRNDGRSAALCLGLALATLAAYANHFQNDFHFDDFHTIADNVYIEHLSNIPRFFTDAATFSSQPEGQTWRPLTSTSLAIDYWMGRGLKPLWFHISTFFWFGVQLVLMFFLFRRLMDLAHPHPSNLWTALVAALCYGLHPANAETVNYIIQRGDLYNTLAAVACVLWFAARPAGRKWGWYLIPAALGILAKAPALIFPLFLLFYVFLFEQEGTFGSGNAKKWAAALRASAPAFAVAAVGTILTVSMTPASYNPGAVSASAYRLTQPWVALAYFRSFFLPTQLSADTDWTPVGAFSVQALAGYAFVAALAVAAVFSARRRQTRPIAFGIVWFVVALLPTSLMPLADVTNDHRMFFPFVGLALAVWWSLRLVLFRLTAGLTANRKWLYGGLAATVVVLAASAVGTHERNQVWRSEESLWHDVTVKSPGNARGWMNYGIVFLARQQYSQALPYLERSAALNANYAPLMVNLALAYSGLGRDDEAAASFRRAEALAPLSAMPYLHYGRWLMNKGRLGEAQAELEKAVQMDRRSFDARDLLTQVYAAEGNREAADKFLEETVKLAFNDETAKRYMEERARREKNGETLAQRLARSTDPEALLNFSAEACKAGKYEDCLAAARRAVELRPRFAEAYNNMTAALLSMQRWDEGIAAARKALAIQPGYEAARSNLEFALEQKRKARRQP